MVAASPVSTPDCRYLNRRSSDGCENTRSSNWSEDEALNRSASTLRSLSRGHWLCPPRNRRSRHEYDRTSDCRLLPLFARDSGGYLLSNDPCGNESRARHGTRRGNVLHIAIGLIDFRSSQRVSVSAITPSPIVFPLIAIACACPIALAYAGTCVGVPHRQPRSARELFQKR